jgi:uracil-DNA glycosylase
MILIVGEAPGRRPGQPLSGRCGDRLAALLQLPRQLWDLSGEVSACNLLDRWPGPAGKGSAFPTGLARLRAHELACRLDAGTVVVLLGRRLARAARVQAAYFEWGSLGRARCVVVPHPSGVNRWWNDQANQDQAARFFARLRQVPSRSSVPSQTNSPSRPSGR